MTHAAADPLIKAYLDLMRESLIGRLNRDPALPGSKAEGFNEEFRENGWDWPSTAPSMIGAKRMESLRQQCERALAERVPGDFVETGVWRGGACIMMRAVLKAHGDTKRRVIAADTFAGPPAPARGAEADKPADFHANGFFAVSLDEVKSNFVRYGLLDGQVVFLKGLFHETLPSAPVNEIAVLRLDGDLYESTMDGLNHLYGKLSRGGTLIVDDYFLFDSQREAVDEFRRAHGIEDTIVQVDHFGGYWIKR